MNIGILGTGNVGDTIGSRLIELGHSVMMGSRTADNVKAAAFVANHEGKAKAGTFAEAATFGEIIFNCTRGEHAVSIIEGIAAICANKILIDLTNPLDFTKGSPPCLIPSLSNTYSLGEAIQKAAPQAYVVKTFNTMWCGIMVNPMLIGGGDHINYVCGNDHSAKQKVKELLLTFGWKKENLMDLGDISNARATEAILPIWIRVWAATKNNAFNYRIVS